MGLSIDLVWVHVVLLPMDLQVVCNLDLVEEEVLQLCVAVLFGQYLG